VDLFVVDVATGVERPLVTQAGRDAEPSWPADGKWIAFHSQAGSRNYFEARHVGLVPAAGGAVRYVTESFGADVFRGATRFGWIGHDLVFGAGKGTSDNLYAIDLRTGGSRLLAESLAGSSSFSFSREGSLAFLRASASRPPEIWVATQNGTASQLTRVHDELSAYPTMAVETVRWKSSDGMPMEGVFWLPPRHKAGSPVPLLVELHGGPTGVALESFPVPRTYPTQLFAQDGFAVFAPNFRGSANYGAKLRLANIDSQGFGDFDDVMTGIDMLVAKGIADPKRLGVMGWSYGGFLTAWIIGHSNRFKAASIGAPATDWTTYYGASDGPRDVLWTYFGGTPWEKGQNYDRHSPRSALPNVRTPALLQHGERDIDHCAEIYQALTDTKVPVEFVTYPREGHGIGEPAHQLDVMRRNLAWFRKWVLGGSE
jgi:dipeptidyl aminopeptidase/acylaminoacyl peptidase